MNCPKCKMENPDNAQICSSCGQMLTSNQQQTMVLIPKTSKSATAALVLGILSPFTCMITSLPAIICGIVALVKINKTPDRLKGNGLAIAGICLPVVLVPVMALLMGILMPALARTRQIAFRMVCGTNLAILGRAMNNYASDNDGKFPTSSKWCDLLIQESSVEQKHFLCKGDPEGPCSYAMNRNVERLGKTSPPDMVLLFESSPGWNQVGGPEILNIENHQEEGCNVLFVDGHAAFIKSPDLRQLRWTNSP